MIVLDANILIRALLGRRVRQLIETYAARGVRFFAPQLAFDDAQEYIPELLAKFGKSAEHVPAALEYLSTVIEPITADVYGSFEEEARLRLQGRDEDDWPVLAAALALGCPLWSEDADFFGTGIAVWTTGKVEILLEKLGSTASF